MIASTSRAERTRYSSPLYFTSVPPYLLYSTTSPTLDVERKALAVLEAARTNGQDDALLGLLLGGVRNDQAGGRGLLGVERLDHNAVLERLDGNLGAGGRHDPISPFGDLTGLTVWGGDQVDPSSRVPDLPVAVLALSGGECQKRD